MGEEEAPDTEEAKNTEINWDDEEQFAKLLKRVREEDQDAITALYDRVQGPGIGHARNKLRNFPSKMCDAEDIFLQAFFKLLSALPKQNLENMDNVTAFLSKIINNQTADHIRFEQRLKRGGTQFPISLVSSDRDTLTAPDKPIPEVVIETLDRTNRTNRTNRTLVEDLMNKIMPHLSIHSDLERIQEVLTRSMDGWKPKKIANSLGVVQRTVERDMRRVRNAMKAAGIVPQEWEHPRRRVRG